MSRYDEGLIAPKTLTDRETELLLRATGERRGGFRDHMLFSMALGTALREHELVALNVGDVFDDDGDPRRRVPLTVFKRSNDDRNLQQILLNETVRAKLAKYRAWKTRNGESVAPDAPLFVSRNSKRLSTRQVRRLIHVWQRRAGVEANLSFHGLRHYADRRVMPPPSRIRGRRRGRDAVALGIVRGTPVARGESLRRLAGARRTSVIGLGPVANARRRP